MKAIENLSDGIRRKILSFINKSLGKNYEADKKNGRLDA